MTDSPFSIQVSTDLSSQAPYNMFHCETEIGSSSLNNYYRNKNSVTIPSKRDGFLRCKASSFNPTQLSSSTVLAFCNPIFYNTQDTNTYKLSYSSVSGCMITSNNDNGLKSTFINTVLSDNSSDLIGETIDVSKK
jgi:hypothetical protein